MRTHSMMLNTETIRNTLRNWALLSTLFILFLIAGQNAYAEDKTPRYQVEVIVFEQLALKGWTEENWPEIASSVDLSNSTSYLTTNQKPLYLRSGNLALTDVAKRMNRGYRVIFHESWTQFAYESRKSPKVLIEKEHGGDSLLGTVKVYKTKFSHIELDLELERTIPNAIRAEFAQRLGLDEYNLPSTWRFKLQEKRKADSGELHYFDHPIFGALVRIQAL
ncbi:CsiV family protein [Thiomicrorhabdus sp. 6S3-12]|uniref:CsiV family protein n=1 Tax=Thiomicrorhabdus sp. 6S3-12 TaxID=2819681 RepID=UPI001AAD4684|nr:CsiV family protein [Thiomicrorhabdus sp. 6S3-12]MBO1924966.1 peptidoglycan binding protein CsiV [Thiomicrorhabdus sp. 6S3-12]